MATSLSEVFYDDRLVKSFCAELFFNHKISLLKDIYTYAILEKGAILFNVEGQYKSMVQDILDLDGIVIMTLWQHKIVLFHDGSTDWGITRQSIIRIVRQSFGGAGNVNVSFLETENLPPSHASGDGLDTMPCGISASKACEKNGPAFLAKCARCDRSANISVMPLARSMSKRGPYEGEAEINMPLPLPQLNGGQPQLLAASQRTRISVRSGRRKRRTHQVMRRKNGNEDQAMPCKF